MAKKRPNVGSDTLKVLVADREPSSAGCDPIGIVEEFQRLADISPRPLEWIWDGLIPRGKLTLITGEPGVGKSVLALQVAAMATRGWQTPRSGSQIGSPVDRSSVAGGAVVLFSADDDPADTLYPRLQVAGADLARVFVMAGRAEEQREQSTNSATLHNPKPADEISRVQCDENQNHQGSTADEEDRVKAALEQKNGAGFRIGRDLVKLETAVMSFLERGIDVRLIVLDPIDCYMSSADKSVDLSMLVARLVDLAARSRAGILVVANSTSSRIGRTGYRSDTIGNLELANAARSVLMIVADLEHDGHRVVLPVKMNLCGNQAGIAFSFVDGAVHWGSDPVALTGDQYFTQARERLRNPLNREEHTEIQRVTEWLRERLSQGTASSVSVRTDAYENEIAYTTLRRAFRRLGCLATRAGRHGKWYWRLPGQALISNVNQRDFSDVQDTSDVQVEHLRIRPEK